MSRSYLVGSWLNADEYDYTGYSGEMLMGHRNGASRDLDHFTKDGRANVAKYGDNDLTQKKTSIPLTDRILPQFKRLRLLNDQMVELEQLYKTGGMSIQDYTVYRDVLSVKRQRAEQLYKRAISVKPQSQEDDEQEDYSHSPTYNNRDDMVDYGGESYAENLDNGSTNTGIASPCGVSWIDELSPTNSFKSFLKSACLVTRKVIHYKHKISSYLQTLKEV